MLGRLSIEDICRFVIYGIVLFGICYREILIWFRYFIFNWVMDCVFIKMY